MGEARPEFENINFTYGHSIGAGISKLFETGDLDQAKLAAFFAWDMDLLAGWDPEVFGSAYKNTNTFPHILQALDKFWGNYLILSKEWELFYYADERTGDRRAAVELSARVDFPNNFVYRIFIDLVLRNKNTHELLVFELKSDGMKYVEEAKYANSNQALSYAVILDKIQPGATSFVIWYAVYYKSLERWEFFPFPKSRIQKANWIRTVLYDTSNIKQCKDDNFFPKQGESCIDWGRRCHYYGTCDLSNRFSYGPENVIAERVEKEMKAEYTYKFTLSDIVDQQLEDVK